MIINRSVGLARNGVLYPVLTGLAGAARQVLDPTTGTALWTWEGREPFGDTKPTEIKGFTFDGRFPGQWYDEVTGLSFNGHRDYDPKVGRYIEPDPMGLAAGPNPYAYGEGEPVEKVDPLGLAWQLVVGGGGAVIVPFFGGGANFNIGINIDGLESSIYIQDQANLGAPTVGGAFLGAGLNLSLSHAGVPTTGFDSAPYIEGDAGYLGGLGASATRDKCGVATFSGTKGIKPGVGIGLGAFLGTTYTSTAVSTTLKSILPYLYAY